jgi:hypothetical protein
LKVFAKLSHGAAIAPPSQKRFRRPSYGSLEIELTVDDPKAYTKPWTVTFKQAIMPDTDLLNEICLETRRACSTCVAADGAGNL